MPFPSPCNTPRMAERNVIGFIIIALATFIAMTGLSQLLPDLLDIPVAYGIVVSAVGISIILFAWHVWVQTSPGGVDLEAYVQRPPTERLVDFALLVVASAVVAGVGAVVGIEGGIIEGDELWGGDTTSWIAGTVVVILGMAAGILTALRRNSDIRIQREARRGE